MASRHPVLENQALGWVSIKNLCLNFVLQKTGNPSVIIQIIIETSLYIIFPPKIPLVDVRRGEHEQSARSFMIDQGRLCKQVGGNHADSSL